MRARKYAQPPASPPGRIPGHSGQYSESSAVRARKGSSRHSLRNRYVATVLNQAGLGTLLLDLLTLEEEADRANVFDVESLARRLADVTNWLRVQPSARHAPSGYFGASTGAAAALWAASEPGADVAAVVSWGGWPDLAHPRLAAVTAPALLFVGGLDTLVLELNREARA